MNEEMVNEAYALYRHFTSQRVGYSENQAQVLNHLRSMRGTAADVQQTSYSIAAMKRSVADVRQSLERVRGGDESEGELDREGQPRSKMSERRACSHSLPLLLRMTAQARPLRH